MLEADDFGSNPYAHVTNQAGHAMLVGVPLALSSVAFGLPLESIPIVAAIFYGVIWEMVIQRGRLWADSLMDTVCVMAGAAVICGAMHSWQTAVICWFAYAVLVAIGGFRRWEL